VHAIATRGKKISRGRRQESAGEARFRVGKACRWTATTKSNDPATPRGLLAGLAPEVWHKDTTCGGEVNVGRRGQAAAEAAASKKGLIFASVPSLPCLPCLPNVFGRHGEMAPAMVAVEMWAWRLLGRGWPAAAVIGLRTAHTKEFRQKVWPAKLEQRIIGRDGSTRPYYRHRRLGAQLAKLTSLTGGSAEGPYSSSLLPKSRGRSRAP
jgi:hypothetical protein